MLKFDNRKLTRTFELKGQNSVTFIQNPRTGFWTFKFEKGGLPVHLDGARFTEFDVAFDTLNQYLKTREKFKQEIGREL